VFTGSEIPFVAARLHARIRDTQHVHPSHSSGDKLEKISAQFEAFKTVWLCKDFVKVGALQDTEMEFRLYRVLLKTHTYSTLLRTHYNYRRSRSDP
jgi:hypothetical protein